jgi:hypothetical protein
MAIKNRHNSDIYGTVSFVIASQRGNGFFLAWYHCDNNCNARHEVEKNCGKKLDTDI